ncbi:MAG: hypothetical protein QOI73_1076 [Solirubrobacteraceae bacterium]|nr:hypothetical protein [Solirubrobacteraceae bacterium]
MKRTTVKLPDDLDARLRHAAARHNLTVSEMTGLAIAAYLGSPQPGGRRHFLSAGAGRSGRSDLSVNIEEILAGEVN